MLVHVLSFGTNWWARFGRDIDDPHRFTRHAAYYNSTGVRCGGKVRRHWIIPGLIRFNGAGDFNPNVPDRAVGHTFVCSDLSHAFGGYRLLFQVKAHKSSVPDCYLVVVSSDVHGAIDFSSGVWKSVFSPVIAVSHLREKQEAMLLMRLGDWIQTNTGFWQLSADPGSGQQAALSCVGGKTSV